MSVYVDGSQTNSQQASAECLNFDVNRRWFDGSLSTLVLAISLHAAGDASL